MLFDFFSAVGDIKLLEVHPEGRYIRIINASEDKVRYQSLIKTLFMQKLNDLSMHTKLNTNTDTNSERSRNISD